MTTTTSVLHIPDIDPDADNLTAALAYAAAGWYVLPVKRGTKKPGSVVGDHWQDKSSRDPKQITAWFAGTDHDVALHCGRSGAVVFDVDDPEKLPDVLFWHLNSAPYQSTRPDTPGRGHYVFAQPPGRTLGNSTGRLGGAWGEVRGLNGVIIAEPSHHKDGGEYHWGRTGPAPVLPNQLAEQLDDASPAEDAATDAEVAAFIAEHQQASRPEILAGLTSALRKRFEAGESRHQSTVTVLPTGMKEARAGFYPAQAVIDTFKPMFLEAVAKPPASGKQGAARNSAVAKSEWDGMAAWAVGQALAADLDDVRARTDEKMPNNTEWVDHITVNGDHPAGDADDDVVKHSGHLGMAIKLGNQFGNHFRYVHGVGWHHWDGKRWAPDGDGAARRAVHTVIKRDRRIVKRLKLSAEEQEKWLKQIARYETASAISGILTEAAALQAFSVVVGDLDADPYLINCANGTLDLRTLRLRPHNPADLITKVTRAAYDPGAVNTTWIAFLEKVLPEKDIRDYLRRVLGVALLGKVIEHNLVILTGPGRNGKGTLYKAVCFALGDYADMADPELFMDRKGAHPTADMTLLGLRLAVVSESGRDRALDEARMKRLTGGDIISARYLYQNQVTFEPSHLALFVTNFLPKVSGDDEAVWARLRVVQFNVVIPEEEQDKNLDEKLQAEADALLAWAVAGWSDYRARAEMLDEPAGVQAATKKYRTDSDDVGRFLDDDNWCLQANTLKTTTAQLHAGYLRWAKQEGGDAEIGLKAFGRALDSKGFPVTSRTEKGRWRDGIALRPRDES